MALSLIYKPDHESGFTGGSTLEGMGLTHSFAATQETGETAVINWISGNRPKIMVHHRKWAEQQNIQNIAKDVTSDEATIESNVEAWEAEYNSTEWEKIGGVYLLDEEYELARWTQIKWIVEKLAGDSDVDWIIDSGNAVPNGEETYYPPAFFTNFWVSSKALFVATRYADWAPNWEETCVQCLEDEWRKMADLAGSSSTKKWVGLVQAWKGQWDNTPAGYIPSQTEQLLQTLGPLAHGARGIAYAMFDTCNDSDKVGCYDTDCEQGDDATTMRSRVVAAKNRMNQVEGYLSGWAYNGCEYNTDENSYKDLYDSLGWMLRRLEAGGFTWDKKVEIGRFGEDPSSYVICNRDPRDGGGRDVTAYFYSPSEIKVDGELVEGGELQTSWTFNLPQGDAKVVTVM